MSEQAIETDDIEIEVTEEVEAEEVDVVIEGEEKPTSKPRGLARRFKKLAGQRDEAKGEAATLKAELEAERQAKELWKLKATQGTDKPPKEDDFEDAAEYNAAKSAFDEAKIERMVDKRAQEIINQNQSQNTQAQQGQAQQTLANEHYARAEDLKVPDYEKAEDEVLEVIGQDLFSAILAGTDRSERVIYYLSKNPAKANDLVDLSVSNPVRCAAEIGRLGAEVKLKPKHSATPDPETVIDKGDSAEGFMKGVKIY